MPARLAAEFALDVMATLRRARAIYPLLRDSDLELVHRELGRVRDERYGLTASDSSEDLG